MSVQTMRPRRGGTKLLVRERTGSCMRCPVCTGGTATDGGVCSARCGVEAEIELARNRARIKRLRATAGIPDAELRGLMDRNAELRAALSGHGTLVGT